MPDFILDLIISDQIQDQLTLIALFLMVVGAICVKVNGIKNTLVELGTILQE